MTLPDKDSGSTYGALSKIDYQNLPPADPTTDWSNPLIAPAFCNVAGITQTVPRAVLTATLDPSDGYIVLVSYASVWGNITTTAPVCHHVSTGIYTFTWPSVVSDEYNASFGNFNTHSVNFTRGWVNLQNPGAIASGHVTASANVLTLTLYNASGLSDFTGVTVDVWGAY